MKCTLVGENIQPKFSAQNTAIAPCILELYATLGYPVLLTSLHTYHQTPGKLLIIQPFLKILALENHFRLVLLKFFPILQISENLAQESEETHTGLNSTA